MNIHALFYVPPKRIAVTDSQNNNGGKICYLHCVYMTLPLPVGYNSDQDDNKSSIIAKVVINDRVFLQCFFSFAFWSLVSVDVDLLITCASIFILYVF